MKPVGKQGVNRVIRRVWNVGDGSGVDNVSAAGVLEMGSHGP